ncbi:MAG: hypothetical protein AAB336_04855 [Acidobacteriota bacterium]
MQTIIKSNNNYSLPNECKMSILQFLSKNKALISKTELEIEGFGKSIFENVIKFLVETKNDKITIQSVNIFLAGMPIKD